jgi:hypothetical protein
MEVTKVGVKSKDCCELDPQSLSITTFDRDFSFPTVLNLPHLPRFHAFTISFSSLPAIPLATLQPEVFAAYTGPAGGITCIKR